MRQFLSIGAAAAALAATVAGFALAAGPAGAAAPAYSLKASGTALKISLGGTSLTGGTATASAGSSANPTASGAGEVTPAIVGSQEATVTAPGTSQTLAKTCAQPSVPFPAPFSSLIALGVGCSSAAASEASTGLPSANATGLMATLGLSPSASALPLPITVKSTVGTALGKILGTLPTTLTKTTPLNTVLSAVAKAAGSTLTFLVKATLGSASSSVSATTSGATAKSAVAGSTISLLGGVGISGKPLLTVTVGGANATVSVDRATGQVTASDTPAVVTVTLNSPVGGTQSFSLAPGVSQTFLSGTPLATTISLGSGTATSGSGKGSATASGANIDALQGLGATTSTGTNGGIDLDLAYAAVSATAAVPAPPAVTPPPAATAAANAPAPTAANAPAVTGATTVHTGEFWNGPLPIALVGLGMLTGIGLLTRRHLGVAAHRLTHLARGASSPAGGTSPGPVAGTSSVPPPVSGPARRQSK